MNNETKIQPKEEFIRIVCNIRGRSLDDKQFKAIIEYQLDSLLKSQRDSLVESLKQGLFKRMMKYDSKDGYSTIHDEVLEKVSNDVDDIIKSLESNI